MSEIKNFNTKTLSVNSSDFGEKKTIRAKMGQTRQRQANSTVTRLERKTRLNTVRTGRTEPERGRGPLGSETRNRRMEQWSPKTSMNIFNFGPFYEQCQPI